MYLRIFVDKIHNEYETNIKNGYSLPAGIGIYPHVNGTGTSIIVSVPVDTRIR